METKMASKREQKVRRHRGRDKAAEREPGKVYAKYVAVRMNPKIRINPQVLQETRLSTQKALQQRETLAEASAVCP